MNTVVCVVSPFSKNLIFHENTFRTSPKFNHFLCHNFMDFSSIFITFSASIFASIFYLIFNENGSQNGPGNCPSFDPWNTFFAIFSQHRFLDACWSLFGSLLSPFGLQVAPFGFLLTPVWTPLAPFWCVLVTFGLRFEPFAFVLMVFSSFACNFCSIRFRFA